MPYATRRERVLFVVLMVGFTVLGMIVGGLISMGISKAWGAELELPPIIRCGQVSCDGEIGRFGTYADHYYVRRWKRMCQTGARYDAMREANDLGKRNPC